MTAELHHNAVVAAIRGDTQLASVVFEVGEVPTDPAPTRYVVVASSLGDWSQTRFTGSHDGLLTTHTVYCHLRGVRRFGRPRGSLVLWFWIVTGCSPCRSV